MKNSNLSKILKAGRLKKNLSLQEVEKKTGIYNVVVDHMERGIDEPGFFKVMRLVKLYEIEFDDWLHLLEDKT